MSLQHPFSSKASYLTALILISVFAIEQGCCSPLGLQVLMLRFRKYPQEGNVACMWESLGRLAFSQGLKAFPVCTPQKQFFPMFPNFIVVYSWKIIPLSGILQEPENSFLLR